LAVSPIPVPEPSAGLVINGVKTTGTGLWKLWIAYGNHRETRELLRASLAIAICDEHRQALEVESLAVDLEAALHKTGIPSHGKRGFLERVKRVGRKLLPRRGFREVPAVRVFGPNFGEHLTGWLRETTRSGEFADRLAAIDCEQECTLEALAQRLPEAFEEELFNEETQSSFREQLTRELLLTDYVRQEKASREGRRSVRKRAARVATTAAAPGGIVYAAADALGASDPKAAAIALGAAGLGAVVGTVAWGRAESVTGKQGAARREVLRWVAGLLQRITGKERPADSKALEAALYTILQDAAHDRLPWPSGLAEASIEVRELRKTVSVAGDEMLDRELGEFETALRGATTNINLRRQALGRLYSVIVACDLPPRLSK
jgi:hypothetical protein